MPNGRLRHALMLLPRFQVARNARIVAAYEERLAMKQDEAPEGHLAVGSVISTVVSAKVGANRTRQRPETKQNAAELAEQAYTSSLYFRRQKVVVGVSSSCLVNTISPLILLLLMLIIIIIIIISGQRILKKGPITGCEFFTRRQCNVTSNSLKHCTLLSPLLTANAFQWIGKPP